MSTASRSRSARAYAEVRNKIGDVSAHLQESISGVRVLKAFRREQSDYERLQARAHVLGSRFKTGLKDLTLGRGMIGDEVTVEQLLAHRSGIGDYLDEETDVDYDAYLMPVPVQDLEIVARPAAPAAPAVDPVTAQLTNLASLHAAGILSDEEYAAAKAKALGI